MISRLPIYFAFLVLSGSGWAQAPSEDYQLIFEDDFATGTLNPDAWWPAGGDNCATHGEGDCEEDMWYKPENIEVQDGRLIITAKEDSITCGGKWKAYTSGWVQSAANFRYGYYEVRAKMPRGNGLWPAFWFWASSNDTSYEEIDVLEYCGCNCNEYQSGHWYEVDHDGIVHNAIEHPSGYVKINDGCSNFYTYGVEWTQDSIVFFLEGQRTAAFENVNIHDPMAIILNLAVGGCYGGCNWTYCGRLKWETDGGCHVDCKTVFPQSFEIEWVKAWQKPDQVAELVGNRVLYPGETGTLRLPHYLNAELDWVCDLGLSVQSSPYLNFDKGIWRTASVSAKIPGIHEIRVHAQFETGTQMEFRHQVEVLEDPELSWQLVRRHLLPLLDWQGMYQPW